MSSLDRFHFYCDMVRADYMLVYPRLCASVSRDRLMCRIDSAVHDIALANDLEVEHASTSLVNLDLDLNQPVRQLNRPSALSPGTGHLAM
jgi:hypothetical protein